MHSDHPNTHRRANRYKREFVESYFRGRTSKQRGRGFAWAFAGSNVVGLGFGAKETGGSGLAAPEAVRIYVRRKLPMRRVRVADRFPGQINGLPTDVIEVGETRLLQRPVEGGVSGSHPSANPGTLGCLVQAVGNPGRRFILSCNHVLANCGQARLGDPVLEPAPGDAGSGASPIGVLRAWVRLLPAGNLMDCALAELMRPEDFLPTVRFLGAVDAAVEPATTHLAVQKSGRNPPHLTLGMIADVSADLAVPYPQGGLGFVRQIVVRDVGGPFAGPGDSGALVVDARTRCPVGLVFAGGSGVTYVNPIGPILAKLRVEIATN